MTTQKVRRGMHVRLNWPILRAGVNEDFSNAESLSLHISRVNNNVKTFIPDTHISISGNLVSFIVTSDMLKSLTSGEYKATIAYRKVSATSPTLWEPYIKDEPCFALVDSSAEIGGSTTGMEVVTIELDGEIGIPKEGQPGASAYRIALAHGFEGDEAEWLLSLKQPAIDAAGLADSAAQKANTAAENADAKAGLANSAAQTANTAAENADAKAGLANSAAQTANTAAENADAKAGLANSAAQTANTAAENADAKTGLANSAAQTANTAAENADAKAGLANSAAQTANTAAENADAKAGLANSAAQTANTAADSANTAAGAQNTYNVTVAIPLAAGSYYTKSTARAAVPVVSRKLGLVNTYALSASTWYTEKFIGSNVSGWTTESNWEQVPDAAKLATLETDLNKGNLLSTYVYNSNLEVQVSSLDILTGTFTKVNHGLVNGYRISPIMNINAAGLSAITVFPSTMSFDAYYVVGVTADTFNISSTLNGPAILFTANPSMNLTKWHFEKIVYPNIVFTNLPNLTAFRLNISIKTLEAAQFYIQAVSADSFRKNTETNPFEENATYNAIRIPKAHWGLIEITGSLDPIMQYSIRGTVVGYSAQANKMKMTSIDRYVSINTAQTSITSLALSNHGLANGSVIKLYKY